MGLYEDAIAQVGPRPKPVGSYKLWGFPVNLEEGLRSTHEQETYDALLKATAAKLVDQRVNPFRDATLGDVSRIGGHNPSEIAGPGQLIPHVTQQPSEVPSIGFGEAEPTGRFNFGTPQASLRPGPMIDVTRMEPNLDAPASLPQQMLGVSDLHRQSFQPRFNPNGQAGGALMQKYKLLSESFGPDAAARIIAGEPLEGGIRESALTTRNEATKQHGELYGAQTQGQLIKNQHMPQEYQDKHESASVRVEKTRKDMERQNQRAALQNELIQLDMKLKQAKLRGDSPDTRIAEEKLNLAKKKFQLASAYLLSEKMGTNPEAEAILEEMMADTVGIIGDIHKQGFFERMFSDKPVVSRKPTSDSGSTATQPSTQPGQTDVTAEINKMLSTRGVDPAQAQQSGVKYQGKVYRYNNGKWSE